MPISNKAIVSMYSHYQYDSNIRSASLSVYKVNVIIAEAYIYVKTSFTTVNNAISSELVQLMN